MNIGIFVWICAAILAIIYGIYRGLEIFADAAERECAKGDGSEGQIHGDDHAAVHDMPCAADTYSLCTEQAGGRAAHSCAGDERRRAVHGYGEAHVAADGGRDIGYGTGNERRML